MASLEGHAKIVSLLLQGGADFNKKNKVSNEQNLK